MRRALPLLLSFVCLSLLGCPPGGGLPAFRFVEPADDQLSLAGDVHARLKAPKGLLKKGTLTVTLDGEDVTDLFDAQNAELPSAAGVHELVATLELPDETLVATRTYETILVTED